LYVCGTQGEHIRELTVIVDAFNNTLELDLLLNACVFLIHTHAH